MKPQDPTGGYKIPHMQFVEVLNSSKNSLLTAASLQLSAGLKSFTLPPQTGTENHLIFPGGKTGDVNYSNSSAINPCTGLPLVSLPCVFPHRLSLRYRRSYRVIGSI